MALYGLEFEAQTEETDSFPISPLEGLGTRGLDAPHDAISGDDDPVEEGERDGLLDHVPSRSTSHNVGALYASVALLSPYISAVDPSSHRANTLRVQLSKRKSMLRIHLCLAAIAIVATFGVTVWLVRRYPPDAQGVGTIIFGSCSTTSTASTAAHAVLNIISTLFLAAGNYCMQILVAPSRQEIEKAHEKGKSLIIGVHNLGNLRHINRSRATAWVLIGFFSTQLHLFWNSAVFTSIPWVSYPIAYATSDVSDAADNWVLAHPIVPADLGPPFEREPQEAVSNRYQNVSSVYALHSMTKEFTQWQRKECLKNYVNPLESTRALILVSANVTATQNNGSSLIGTWVSGWSAWNRASQWICHVEDMKVPNSVRWCTWDRASQWMDEWAVRAYNSTMLVDHCLVGEAGDNNQRCGFHYSVYILPIVCISTLSEGILILWTWSQLRNPETNPKVKTLITMGDAVAEFLEKPSSVEDRETYSSSGNPVVTPQLDGLSIQAGPWSPQGRVSWLKAVDIKTWILSLLLLGTGLVVPSLLLYTSFVWMKKMSIDDSPSTIWNEGFSVNGAYLVNERVWVFSNHGLDYLEKVLVANGFQMVLSFLYLFYNNILTRQLVADEWIRFLRKEGKKPLRVSSPVGMQRSSYTLSLPMKYSIPLMLAMICLHWLISESLFLTRIQAFGPGSDIYRIPDQNKFEVGYSNLGIVLSIAVGSTMVIALLVNSAVRKYENAPVGYLAMATNSAAICAACRPPVEDKEAHLFEVRLGVVKYGKRDHGPEIGQITFSTHIDLEEPQSGAVYLQPVATPSTPFTVQAKHSIKRLQRGSRAAPTWIWRTLTEVLILAPVNTIQRTSEWFRAKSEGAASARTMP